MFYTIYQITCTINRKIYIGKHQTTDLNDGYMGSGKILKIAIDLYGIENFQKEILHVFDNEEEMNKMEAEIVNEQFLSRDDVYNLCLGGQGGFSYINMNGLKTFTFSNLKDSQRAEISRKGGKATCLKNLKKLDWTGKKHSEETKEKMRKSKNSGSLNSQFGTCWITNGIENKKIKKDVDNIPEGWYKGRK